MEFGDKLKKFVGLKQKFDLDNTLGGNENIQQEYKILNKYFFDLYMEIRLRTGKDPGNEFNFERWIKEEHTQMIDIENLLNDDYDDIPNEESELEMQMKTFDNLGFDNVNTYNWRKSILIALEENNYKMDDFYYTKYNTNNKQLFQHIAQKSETYNFLISKGLLNVGNCPITGEKINNSLNYNIFNRQVYLSEKGLEVCKSIDKKEWTGKNMDYDSFQKLKAQTTKKSKSKAQFVILIIVILSLIFSWLMISPTGFFSFLGFLILGVIFFYILGWIFNLLFDLYV